MTLTAWSAFCWFRNINEVCSSNIAAASTLRRSRRWETKLSALTILIANVVTIGYRKMMCSYSFSIRYTGYASIQLLQCPHALPGLHQEYPRLHTSTYVAGRSGQYQNSSLELSSISDHSNILQLQQIHYNWYGLQQHMILRYR